MALLIGVDEAGYGPNLGPLVVAATAWEVEECEMLDVRLQMSERSGSDRNGASSLPSAFCPLPTPDLYKLLCRAVTCTPDGKRVAIADSKSLYKPGAGLANLERGVLTTLSVSKVAAQQSRWSSLVESLAADVEQRQRELPWHEEFDCEVPCACERDDIHSAGEQLAIAMNDAGVQLHSIRARLVFPREFNDLCEQYGNKAAALSEVTMRLVREVVERIQDSGCGEQGRKSLSLLPASCIPYPLILCDKHGGRNHYAALVQQHFPETWVETLHESRAESWYRTAGEMPLDFCFRMKGEAFLPVALASMTAKYVRELSMRAFNEYWSARVKNLRPTAGYPVDAKRFRLDIAHEQRRLGIADRLLWRNR